MRRDASLFTLWITLIKLSVTVLDDKVIDPFMQEAASLYARLPPLLPKAYEKKCSQNLSAYRRYKGSSALKARPYSIGPTRGLEEAGRAYAVTLPNYTMLRMCL